jgi:hypothetical protein
MRRRSSSSRSKGAKALSDWSFSASQWPIGYFYCFRVYLPVEAFTGLSRAYYEAKMGCAISCC